MMQSRMRRRSEHQAGREGWALYEVLDQMIALLRQRGRVTYRLVKREFHLDDEALADLKDRVDLRANT